MGNRREWRIVAVLAVLETSDLPLKPAFLALIVRFSVGNVQFSPENSQKPKGEDHTFGRDSFPSFPSKSTTPAVVTGRICLLSRAAHRVGEELRVQQV